MNNSVQQLSALPSSKSQIEDFSGKLIRELEEGDINPLEALKQFKAIERVAENVKTALTRTALKEAEKYHEKMFDAYGVKFSIREVGTVYDYSACNDPVYDSLKGVLQEIQGKMKERESFLKALTEPTDIVTEDAEVIRIHPPVKKSTTSVVTNFI